MLKKESLCLINFKQIKILLKHTPIFTYTQLGLNVFSIWENEKNC